MPSASALPEDDIVNVFHFNSAVGNTPAAQSDLDAITVALAAFYNTATAGGNKISTYFSQRNIGVAHCKMYDLGDPEPRVPIDVQDFSISEAGSGDQAPAELALCLSFAAVPTSGAVQARRRGRIYLGPFQTTALSVAERPVALLITTVQQAADRLKDDANTYWAVYSRTNLPNPAYTDTAPLVENGWVDNAWDTQRRRGLAPTVRTTFS